MRFSTHTNNNNKKDIDFGNSILYRPNVIDKYVQVDSLNEEEKKINKKNFVMLMKIIKKIKRLLYIIIIMKTTRTHFQQNMMI